MSVQEKEKVISGLRSRSSEVQSVVVCVERKCAGLDQPPTQFSPEVISTNTVETPTLVIQQVGKSNQYYFTEKNLAFI